MPSLGPLCWLRRTDRGAPQTSGCSFSSSGITNPPGVVLEDLPRVCEEAGPELRSLHVASPGTGRTQVGFARVFLGPGRATGRRHVGTDVPEGGGASPRAAFSENRLSELYNFLYFKAFVCFVIACLKLLNLIIIKK